MNNPRNTAPTNSRGALPEVALTREQTRLWEQTRARFMYECPAFTHVMYTMMNPGYEDEKAIFTNLPQIPVAATDGTFLIINPEPFFKYSLQERVFIMGHEILHAIFDHCGMAHGMRTKNKVVFTDGSSLPYEDSIMQQAADFVINAILVESKVGKAPSDCLFNTSIATHNDAMIEVYRRLYKDPSKTPRGQKGFDKMLPPGAGQGKNPTQASQDRNKVEWDAAVAAGMASALMQGKLSGALKSLFTDILSPQVSWQDYIMGFFRRRTGSGSWNWRSPDRRMISRDPHIYMPARSGHGCDHVVVAVDTSGSITQATLNMFFAEMTGILSDVRPNRISVIWCDAMVHRVDEVDNEGDLLTLRSKDAPGRGGTAFGPVFEHVRKEGLKPDALVYLTDGEGRFPKEEPSYPVLWGSILKKAERYPFGEVVMIPDVKG